MQILGLDVGQGYAVGVLLDRFPLNIQRHFKELRKNQQFYKLKTDRTGVYKLLFLSPDAIVLEPSGFWYSAFWERVAVAHGIKIHWVGHADLAAQRKSYGFSNKRDDEDALSLAATYFDERFIDPHGNKRFLRYYRAGELQKLRSLFLAKEQLAKIRSGAIAQIKQRLSYEFPEMAAKQFRISPVRGFTPFLGWLAGIHKSPRYDRLYAQSIAPELGIEISQYSKNHARLVISIEERIFSSLLQIESILEFSQFEKYIEVFDHFRFGTNLKALLLLHIYPIEKFLINGKPSMEYERSRNNKIVKRHRSLRKFQAFLGLAYTTKVSGKNGNPTRSFHGSTRMRSHLYAWALCEICPEKKRSRFYERYCELKNNTKGKDAIIRILFRATRILFYELNKILT